MWLRVCIALDSGTGDDFADVTQDNKSTAQEQQHHHHHHFYYYYYYPQDDQLQQQMNDYDNDYDDASSVLSPSNGNVPPGTTAVSPVLQGVSI